MLLVTEARLMALAVRQNRRFLFRSYASLPLPSHFKTRNGAHNWRPLLAIGLAATENIEEKRGRTRRAPPQVLSPPSAREAMPAPLSDEIVEQGRVLRDSGLGWSTVAKRLGLTSTEGIQRRIDPDYHRRRNEYQAARARGAARAAPAKVAKREKVNEAEEVGSAGNFASSRPTAAMIEAAQCRLLASRTITASLMGDPPPGQSALDRRSP